MGDWASVMEDSAGIMEQWAVNGTELGRKAQLGRSAQPSDLGPPTFGLWNDLMRIFGTVPAMLLSKGH